MRQHLKPFKQKQFSQLTEEFNNYQLKHSQNIINSSFWAEKLVTSAQIDSSDLVLEIGPGRGILTEQILPRCGRLVAIEQDFSFVQELRKKYSSEDRFYIANSDFLDYALPRDCNYKVISNLPFAYTSRFLSKILASPNLPQTMHFVMQKEAAQRFMLQKSRNNTLVGILVACNFSTKILWDLDRTIFSPMPNVDSVFKEFKRKPDIFTSISEQKAFKDFCTFVYTRWKPSVKTALQSTFTEIQLQKISKSTKINLSQKPSEIHFDEWLSLFELYTNLVSEAKKYDLRMCVNAFKWSQKSVQKIYRTRV